MLNACTWMWKCGSTRPQVLLCYFFHFCVPWHGTWVVTWEISTEAARYWLEMGMKWTTNLKNWWIRLVLGSQPSSEILFCQSKMRCWTFFSLWCFILFQQNGCLPAPLHLPPLPLYCVLPSPMLETAGKFPFQELGLPPLNMCPPPSWSGGWAEAAPGLLAGNPCCRHLVFLGSNAQK